MKNKKIITLIITSLILTGCKEKTYTISFDTQGGNLMDNITIKEGTTIKNLEEPVKEGYLFVSWEKDGLQYDLDNPITEDITLTATWTEEPTIINTYTVTYIIDDKIEKTVVRENDILKEPKIPKKKNYLTLGWYLDNKPYDFNTKITKDITLTAKYELSVVTVTYDLDGGVGLAIETIPKNTTIEIPEPPQKKGYRFLKWTVDGKDFSFTNKITKDITIKAIWEKIEYVIITFDSDGGTTYQDKQIEKYSKIESLPIPVKDGYQFVEWQYNNQTFNTDTPIEENITLKAIYKPIEN